MAILPSERLDFLVAAGTGEMLTGTELKVLLHVVACIDNKTGLARIGHARLAERSGVHRGTVMRALARLEQLGILPVASRGGADRGGERTANVYRPNLHYAAPTSSTSATGSLDATGSINASDQSHGCNGPVAPMQHHLGSSPGGFPEGEEAGSPPYAAASANASADRNEREIGAPIGEPESFLEFWAACPVQEHRGKALDAYRVALSKDGASAGELVAGMRQYAAAKAHLVDKGLVALPHNWLAGRRWEDNPQPPKPKDQPQPKPATKAAKTNTAPKVKVATRPKKAKRDAKQQPIKSARASSGGGLPPQPMEAPPRHRGALDVGSRVQHTYSGLIGTVTVIGPTGSAFDVQWDGLDGAERLPRHSLRDVELPNDAAEANRTIRDMQRRRAQGRRLEGKRVYRKLSHEDLADLIRWPADTIAEVEAGRYDGADLPAIIDALEGAIDHY